MNAMPRCRCCRHGFYEFHVETPRRAAFAIEIILRRCMDCTRCIQDLPAGPAERAESDDREAVPA